MRAHTRTHARTHTHTHTHTYTHIQRYTWTVHTAHTLLTFHTVHYQPDWKVVLHDTDPCWKCETIRRGEYPFSWPHPSNDGWSSLIWDLNGLRENRRQKEISKAINTEIEVYESWRDQFSNYTPWSCHGNKGLNSCQRQWASKGFLRLGFHGDVVIWLLGVIPFKGEDHVFFRSQWKIAHIEGQLRADLLEQPEWRMGEPQGNVCT